MFAALLIAVSSFAGEIIAFMDAGDGARFSLTYDECKFADGADGVVYFTYRESMMEGCWKYDKESNLVHIIIEDSAYSIPATLFTAP